MIYKHEVRFSVTVGDTMSSLSIVKFRGYATAEKVRKNSERKSRVGGKSRGQKDVMWCGLTTKESKSEKALRAERTCVHGRFEGKTGRTLAPVEAKKITFIS